MFNVFKICSMQRDARKHKESLKWLSLASIQMLNITIRFSPYTRRNNFSRVQSTHDKKKFKKLYAIIYRHVYNKKVVFLYLLVASFSTQNQVHLILLFICRSLYTQIFLDDYKRDSSLCEKSFNIYTQF